MADDYTQDDDEEYPIVRPFYPAAIQEIIDNTLGFFDAAVAAKGLKPGDKVSAAAAVAAAVGDLMFLQLVESKDLGLEDAEDFQEDFIEIVDQNLESLLLINVSDDDEASEEDMVPINGTHH